jgi:serine/threonine-protein kinase
MRGVLELSGTSLKGLVLGNRLGGTNHTAVYRATARGGGGELAVKVVDSELEPEADFWERLRREAVLISEIGHPDILPIYDGGRADNLTFAATPLVKASTLHDLLRRRELDNELAWHILSQIADALDTVHYRGLVCRLLKPTNILVDDSGRVFLAEFGMASRRVGPMALSTPGYRLASPQYLAPEQVEGEEPDWRADIYAMAVLVFEILTRTPLQPLGRSLSETLEGTLLGHMPSAHARQPDLPRGVDAVLGRAMARNPRERQSSAWELLDELVTLADEGPAPVTTVAISHNGPAVAAPAATVAAAATASTAPLPKARHADNSMVSLLHRLGVPILESRKQFMLNSYFAALVRFGKQACGPRWPDVLQAAGLQRFLKVDPPDEGERTTPVADASRLAEAIEHVFGPGAPEILRQWGRLTSEFWIVKTQQLQDGSVTYLKPLRIMAGADQKVEDILYITGRNLDRVRGERLTVWKQIDKHQFWMAQYDNLMVVGRHRSASSCYFWTSALESALRWGGMANEWIVDEAECGSVTGTFDCIFTVKRVAR